MANPINDGIVYTILDLNRNPRIVHNIMPWHRAGWNGEGLRIAVIDNRIDPTIEFLKGSAVNGKSHDTFGLFQGSSLPDTRVLDGHGQRVSQIIRHFAPAAKIFVLPYYRQDGESTSRVVLEDSLQWCIDNNIHIVNASIPGATRATLRLVSEKCIAAGIILITSAGNRPSAPFDPNDPEETQTLTALATLPKWLAIGNIVWNDYPEETGYLRRSTSSAVGPKLFCGAIGAYNFRNILQDGATSVATGTSYSSPAVVGMLACYYQYHLNQFGNYPTPAQATTWIRNNCVLSGLDINEDWDYTESGFAKNYGYGYGMLVMPSVPKSLN